MSNAVILGLTLEQCNGIYPVTRDGRCQGCGTWAKDEKERREQHFSKKQKQLPKALLSQKEKV